MVDSWLLSHFALQGLIPESSSSNSIPTSPSSGVATLVRKISADEFKRNGLLRQGNASFHCNFKIYSKFDININ
ncbi:hypothetical protein TNCV_3447681 [Trichonephila clavipes]|nr:hypothetical protein TNCV_3447681 [Trichonephila clavipes]